MTNIFIHYAGDSRDHTFLLSLASFRSHKWLLLSHWLMSRTDHLTCGEHHGAFRNLKIIIYLESKQNRNLEKFFNNI